MYFQLGLLLLVSGALCQHQVSQSVQPAVPQAERQIRLEDIEREELKSSAAQQSPAYQQQPAAFQQSSAYQQQAAYTQPQPQVAAYPQQAFYHPTHLQIAPAATAYQTPQYALHPAAAGQQLYHPGAGALQQHYLQPFLLQPQAQPTAYNVPLMLIPYQQELIYPGLKLRAPLPAQQLLPQQFIPQQVVQQQAKFRPSPQIQYPAPYSSQVYQQKFASGVKSTPSPTVKDNYVQQQQGFNYKLQ